MIEYCILNHIGILFCDRSHSPLEMIETTYNQEHRYERLKKQLTLTWFKATGQLIVAEKC